MNKPSTAIIVPLVVDSQNVTDRMHWRERHRAKKTWTGQVFYRVGVCERPFCKMAVTVTSYRPRLITDHANLVGGCKMVIDAIRDAKLIYDDSDQWMVAAYVQHLRSDPSNPMPGKGCTVICVVPFTAPEAVPTESICRQSALEQKL